MNITKRQGNILTFAHLGHTYEVEVADCKFAQNLVGEDEEQFLFTPEMVCVREGCPECARAAEARKLPGYRTPAQTCFPLLGDSQAMEMHLRYRIAARGSTGKAAIDGMAQLMKNDPAALRRLDHAKEEMEL